MVALMVEDAARRPCGEDIVHRPHRRRIEDHRIDIIGIQRDVWAA